MFETKNKQFYWQMFKKYHYLSHSFNNASRTFIATVDGKICGFTAILPFVHPKVKNTWREHRTVILPDFQGIGLGSVMTNEIGEILMSETKSFITTTSNPALIYARRKDPKWICTRYGRASSGGKTGKIQNKFKKGSTSATRITASFKYVGDNNK